ncbi:MAG: hypothetical protein WCT07_02750 [Candidatus Paceibacterota bacterium]|jgi:DNA polymerase III delta prime subunit
MKISDLPNHHAVLLVHDERDSVGVALYNELSSLSPAHRFFNQTVLDIETARAIISWAQTPYNDEKIAIISFHTATLPAQNAMLKILEEPRDGVRFILVTSNKINLIDTVLSRLNYVQDKKVESKLSSLAEEFLQTPNSMRMKLPFTIELLSRIDEEGRKDRESVRAFILSLVEVLSSNHVEPRYVTETLQVASYASDPSASGKALIEYLSLLLPVVK